MAVPKNLFNSSPLLPLIFTSQHGLTKCFVKILLKLKQQIYDDHKSSIFSQQNKFTPIHVAKKNLTPYGKSPRQ